MAATLPHGISSTQRSATTLDHISPSKEGFLTAGTPCRRGRFPQSLGLLEQKDSLLTKESSLMKTPPKLGDKLQKHN
ncbi:UNVERIFIED_CONTAM: hypothetical protein Sradi_3580200 [Sesamum radiatum]|uniref:Uncharacterized protein n=1 Tax=Sesamum radiatum TaxID=300843 RepID=A0AAW2QH07_SESRA